MEHELICTWLELPAQKWPPDYYALLGLPAGEPNLERIEQNVHDRLAKVRKYQLNHPEQVTEAMNLLARAFTCLTDPAAKKSYDAHLLGIPVPKVDGEGAAPTIAPANAIPPVVVQPPDQPPKSPEQQQADWQKEPPPQRVAVDQPVVGETAVSGDAAPLASSEANTTEAPVGPTAEAPVPVPVEPPPPPEPLDPAQALAQSPQARRGLGTKRALYYRIARTRQLLRTWDEAGKFLNNPKRRLTKIVDANELSMQLTTLRQLLRTFPPLLGEGGQPGYFVLALARQEMVVPTFRALLPSQRDTLARDWRDGRAVLLHHRDFLRQELRALRRKSRWARLSRAFRTLLNEKPIVVVIVVGALALALSLWFTLRWGL